MTVKKLIAELNNYPSNLEVFIDGRLTEFKYGLVNGIKQQEIIMSENEDGSGEIAPITAVILSEE